jgi:hypothetical protein
MGVPRRTRFEQRIFGRYDLAHDDRAGRPQPSNDGRIRGRTAALVEPRAEFGRHVGGVDDVLDRNRQTMQRSKAAARMSSRIRPGRRLHGAVLVEIRPSVD